MKKKPVHCSVSVPGDNFRQYAGAVKAGGDCHPPLLRFLCAVLMQEAVLAVFLAWCVCSQTAARQHYSFSEYAGVFIAGRVTDKKVWIFKKFLL